MIDNGNTLIEGKLWFVGPAVAQGLSVDLEYVEDDDIFDQVCDDVKLGTVPAVIYDPRTGADELRFYPEGLDEPDKREVVNFRQRAVSLQDVLAVVDRVHATKLVSPDAQSERVGRLWKTPSKHRPQELAEQMVQMYVETALFVAFMHCTVQREQPHISGRLDLEVVESNPFVEGNFDRHALLELKVLRSYWSSGAPVPDSEIQKWIDEGVDQAASYANELGSKATALCCFDMRKTHTGESCFDQVRTKAAKLGVALRVWHLFASAREYREFCIAKRLAQSGE